MTSSIGRTVEFQDGFKDPVFRQAKIKGFVHDDDDQLYVLEYVKRGKLTVSIIHPDWVN